ncbi:hypothetical protein OF83DRAFT_1175489 [Amylostereum chailletii]|nr:hypothetical protein OF83DRAFT_1175489 [Amylostereum chailletii]
MTAVLKASCKSHGSVRNTLDNDTVIQEQGGEETHATPFTSASQDAGSSSNGPELSSPLSKKWVSKNGQPVDLTDDAFLKAWLSQGNFQEKKAQLQQMLASEQGASTVPTIKKPKLLDLQADSEAGPPLTASKDGGLPPPSPTPAKPRQPKPKQLMDRAPEKPATAKGPKKSHAKNPMEDGPEELAMLQETKKVGARTTNKKPALKTSKKKSSTSVAAEASQDVDIETSQDV